MSAAPIPSNHRRRALVVEADPDTRSLYRAVLEHDGCEVVEATDGRDALTSALVRPPSVVVSELRLPLIDGVSLCEILRRDHATAAVPIVIVTSDSRSTEIDRAHDAGADLVLVKPTPPDVLLEHIQRLTDRTGAAAQKTPSTPLRPPAGRERPKVKAHERFVTTAPPISPAALLCPQCDQPLQYRCSHVGGVSERHPEQWDYFLCVECGGFQYRQRTRKLRHLTAAESRWIAG